MTPNVSYQEEASPGMSVGRVYLLQEEFRQTWIGIRVITGSVLHIHQKHLRKASAFASGQRTHDR